MLISDLIQSADGIGCDLAFASRLVVDNFGSSWEFAPAVRQGLESELAGMFKRMCTPLKSAIEHQYSESGGMDLGAWMKAQLPRCPVLDQAMGDQAQQLVDEFITVDKRLRTDELAMVAAGMMTPEPVLSAVCIASPDKHHGEHVLKLEFSKDSSVYYKPRSGAGAVLLQALSKLVERWGLSLGAANVLARDGYHWMGEVRYVRSCSLAEARRFAHAGGVLYAVATALNASDLHFENLIATGDGPVVIDCETMCQPRFSVHAAAYLLKRPREEHDDVTSLFLNFDRYGGQDIDYGGLSCVDVHFRADPNAGIQVSLPWEQRQLVLHQSRSAVEVDGRRIAPAVEHFDEFARGIREASGYLKAQRDGVLACIPPDAIFRVPLRATRVYGALIGERMSAICFPSYVKPRWSAHLEADLNDAPVGFRRAARSIFELETVDLARLDIPAAYVQARSRDLFLRDARIEGVFDMSPVEVIEARLRGLSPSSVEDQIAKLSTRLTDGRLNAEQRT